MSEEAVALSSRPAPTPMYRWLALLFVSIAMLGNYYFYDALEPLASLLQLQLHFSQADIGKIGAAYSVAPVFTVLIGGVIIDRIGTRKALLLFGSLCMVGALLTASFGNLWMMILGRLTFGMGAEALIVAITTAVAKWFKGRELSFALGINLMLGRLGTSLAQTSRTWAGWAYDSWQKPWLIGAGFVSLCVIGSALYWVLDSRAEKRFAMGQEGEQDKIVFSDLKEFGSSFWWLVGLCLVFYSAIFPFENFAINYFRDAHSVSEDSGGALLNILTMCTMFGTPIVGLFSDKLGRRATMMMGGTALLIPVYLLMGYTSVPLALLMGVLGFAFTFVPAIIWPSVAYVVKPRTLGTALGLMTMIQNGGLAFFNWLLGKSNDMSGASAAHPAGYHLMMIELTALGVIGLFFAFMLRVKETGPKAHGLETMRAGQQ